MTPKRKISLVRWTISLAIMLPLVFIWAMFLGKWWLPYKVVSASMSPTLEADDRVIMKQVENFGNLRDEIIAFKDPTGEGGALTKRVIADENSTVQMRNGQMFVDSASQPVPGETIANVPDQKWEVGPGEVFVVGDNRNDSFDSIDYGPIGRTSILGVITFRYWPWARIGRVAG
ncbi:MAG: signal peptidase I [Candidatus Sumerlaeaceae bacterium]